ncbi:hypothetical protein AV530_011537 [Patagioenas fasciata monilis]|uniref:Uncharacterized protein n=1 Tax=Patagioenas fasciata monilis TaxID=372326 RepID=A0A1V4JJ16_PATFA|nr:hypothetical protein AV530_011537 [Patagioenas fasciata monilis]
MRMTQPSSLPCKIKVTPLKWVCDSLEGRPVDSDNKLVLLSFREVPGVPKFATEGCTDHRFESIAVFGRCKFPQAADSIAVKPKALSALWLSETCDESQIGAAGGTQRWRLHQFCCRIPYQNHLRLCLLR